MALMSTAEKFPASNKLPNQWHAGTQSNLAVALRMQKLADEQFEQSKSSHAATRNDNIMRYQDVHSNFETKVYTTNQLAQLLQDRINSVNTSITLSKQSLGALQMSHQATLAPLQLCTWRQEQRSQRPERELVRDPCEIALEEEKDVLLDAREKLAVHADNTQRMIKALIKSLDDLNTDMSNKAHSLSIDSKCLGSMHKTWPTAGGGVPVVKSPKAPLGRSPNNTGTMALPRVSGGSPSELNFSMTGGTSHQHVAWNMQQEENRQQMTIQLVEKAKEMERSAQALREECDNLIQKVCADSAYAKAQVEAMLQRRVDETTALKEQLTQAITATAASIQKLMLCNSMTRDNLDSHNEPADLLNSRVGLRGQRMPRENIGDPVKTSLDKHAESLRENHNHLFQRHQQEIETLKQLQQIKAVCEADLADKTAALAIDTRCKSQTSFNNNLSFEAMKPTHTKYGSTTPRQLGLRVRPISR